MPVLFDPADERIVRAKASGTLTYDELHQIIGRDDVSSSDVEETLVALQAMGIDMIEDGVRMPIQMQSEEEADRAFLQRMRERGDRGLLLPQLTVEGWNMLLRAQERERNER